MKLYLIRHGHTDNSNSDAERRLSIRGMEQAKKIGIFFRDQNINVSKIGHSDLIRAKETAKIIQQAFSDEVPIVEVKDLRPESNPKIWENNLFLEEEDLLLVGHMPFMSYFYELLVSAHALFPNCGVICLEKKENKQWQYLWKSWE